MDSAGKHEVVGPQSRLLDPSLHGIAGSRCDLELHGALSLVLHHHGPSSDLLAVADVPDLEADEVAAAQLAIDSQVEERELAHPAFHLEANTKCPDVLDLERCLLTDD